MYAINRDLIQATLLTYTEYQDELGQIRKASPSETSIEVTSPQIYSYTQVSDIRFQDVTHTCLSSNKTVTPKNEIKINNITYLILFVNPQGRLTQLMLKEKC